jgi:hypothetical protein
VRPARHKRASRGRTNKVPSTHRICVGATTQIPPYPNQRRMLYLPGNSQQKSDKIQTFDIRYVSDYKWLQGLENP